MVRNQVRNQVRYDTMTQKTSQTDHITTYSNYIEIKLDKSVTAKTIQPSKPIVMIVKYRIKTEKQVEY